MNPNSQDTRVIAKRTTHALDRLDRIETLLPELISGINNSFGSMNQQLNAQAEFVEAVVEMLGRVAIEAAIKDNRERKAVELMESEKKGLEELKAAGAIAVVEKVTEKSIIVGREYNADGSVRHPGRAQVPYARVDANFKEKLLGQSVGFVMELPNTGKFEIVEICEVVQKPDAPVAPLPEAGDQSIVRSPDQVASAADIEAIKADATKVLSETK